MVSKCLKCFKPVKNCFCKYITPFDPEVKIVFLMHPHEAYKERTGTGRLSSLSILDSEIIIDTSFDNNIRTKELINNKNYYPMVLYPSKNPNYAESYDFKGVLGDRKLLIFIIDASWIMAKKMMFRSPSLQALPKISFSKEYKSQFKFKRQPADYCLSTIESAYYLINELKVSGITPETADSESLMKVFKKMVNFQLECEIKYSS